MAASSLNAVRVRLYFDYPPPSMPDCRMSWVLVDLNKCRVVADLCSVIREKFDYSRKSLLDLFIENCFLPPAESIYVVRDNDSIRVKVSSVSCEYVRKKRCREEEGSFQAPTKKNRHDLSEASGAPQPVVTKKKKKHKEKKKKEEKEQQVESGDALKAPISPKEPSSSKSQMNKSSKKASSSSVLTNGKSIPSGSHNKSSDYSDSSEEATQKLSTPKSKPKSKQTLIAGSKQPPARKNTSSDSSSSSSEDEDDKVPVKKSPKATTSLRTCSSTKMPKEHPPSVPPKSSANSSAAKKKQVQSSSDSSSSEDEPSAANGKSSSSKRKSLNTVSKIHPLSATASSCTENEVSGKGSISAKTPPVLQKPLSSSKRAGHQGEASKISTSKNPSGNSKTSKAPTSSDSSSSSEDEACETNAPATPDSVKTAQAQSQPCSDMCAGVENGVTQSPSTPEGTILQDNKDKAESSDSSSDIELVIKKPNTQFMAGRTPWVRGRGITDRVRGRGGGARGSFGRARGTPWKKNFHYSFDDEEQRKQKESQTNKSLVLENPPEPSPRLDYSTLPLLAAPPAVGQKIVFKLLELTENYTPEVSDYKEAKIISFNHSTNMVELELLSQSQAPTEPGKFDLVYHNPDGSERVEYALPLGSQLTERWESLLEPRLIIQNTD